MTSRPLFDASKVSPRAAAAIQNFHSNTLSQISQAVAQDAVVIVGMAQNPYVKKARNALKQAGVEFTYLEYGTYWNNYGVRVAIKMWTGWHTFPQVFVKGVLIGGAADLVAELADGTFQKRIAE